MKRKLMFSVVNYFILTIFALFCIIPLILVLCISITDEATIRNYGYSFIPRKVSFYAYQLLFKGQSPIIGAYGVTILLVIVGTIIAVIITSMAAYSISNKNVKFRNHISFYFFFTMIFSGGIVPWYMVCLKLGLKNNFFALLVPNLIFSPFNLFLVRNYMNGIPDSLMESAKIDGANDLVIAFKIYFPLAKPVLAAISLFFALGYWNDWWNALMLVEKPSLYPLQFFLYRVQSQINMALDPRNAINGQAKNLPAEGVRMATAIVTIGPIILLYPFLQKYFIKGLVIGAVKG